MFTVTTRSRPSTKMVASSIFGFFCMFFRDSSTGQTVSLWDENWPKGVMIAEYVYLGIRFLIKYLLHLFHIILSHIFPMVQL